MGSQNRSIISKSSVVIQSEQSFVPYSVKRLRYVKKYTRAVLFGFKRLVYFIGPCLPTEAPASNAEIIELDSTEHTDKSETQGWQEVNGRKRLRNSPETMPRRQKQTKLNYWLAAPVPTSNSFAELETTDQPKPQIK
ncbi:hypothetical protein EVAR_88760_1 [Eumeta japonica]|uniref:Uncharacterized protein n=1 Tax=Eumeta variegata TaxID=151549 RepID=A0A4C1XR55_EUMVA|nr:hypothetical protein EVAR_88760_1 [Eumeta japonica]